MPKGNTKIQAGDRVVLGGEVYNENADVELTEQEITKSHEWGNKLISEINIPQNVLIIGVRRKNGRTIIPRGNTALYVGDTVILCKGDFVEEIKPDEHTNGKNGGHGKDEDKDGAPAAGQS